MKQKIIGIVVLVVVSCLVLACCAEMSSEIDTAYYFRDNETFSGKVAVPLDGTVWRKLNDRQAQFVAALDIPEISGFDHVSGWVRYDGAALYEVQLEWVNTSQEEYQTVVLYLFPEQPGKYEKVDGMFNLDSEKVTVTQRQGITIYGDGTIESRSRVLETTLENGMYVQIVNSCAVDVRPAQDSLDAMGLLVDFALEHGIEFEAFFDMEMA